MASGARSGAQWADGAQRRRTPRARFPGDPALGARGDPRRRPGGAQPRPFGARDRVLAPGLRAELEARLRQEAQVLAQLALIGLFARKAARVLPTVIFGTAVGALLAFCIALLQGAHYLEIILPGTLVGLLTGFATVRYGRPAAAAPATLR